MAPAERYGYSVARLRALETRLLDESLLQRMTDCEALDSAIKILGETVYSPWLVELKSNDEFDKAIEAELCHVYDEVSQFVPDAGLVQLCRLPYDFHNVKVLIKSLILSKQGGERRFDLLTSIGNIDTDDLTMNVESEEYRLLPFGLNRAVPKVLTMWDQSHDMLAVECYLDGVLFDAMLNISKDLNMASVSNWLKERIDSENVRTLLRLQRMGMDAAGAASFMHKGGVVPVERLLAMLAEPVESWGRVLSFSDVGQVFDSVQDANDIAALLIEFDRVLDDYVTGKLEASKYGSFEPQNIIRYLWLKEMEAKNLRVILVSIANGADRDMVRRLLRHVG